MGNNMHPYLFHLTLKLELLRGLMAPSERSSLCERRDLRSARKLKLAFRKGMPLPEFLPVTVPERMLQFTPHIKFGTMISINDSEEEYLHSSVLRFCLLEPYVPLRNATKRKRLRFGIICRNHIDGFIGE